MSPRGVFPKRGDYDSDTDHDYDFDHHYDYELSIVDHYDLGRARKPPGLPLIILSYRSQVLRLNTIIGLREQQASRAGVLTTTS